MAPSPRSVRVATTQFYSHTDVPANLQLCTDYMRQAKKVGAELIVFPESKSSYATQKERLSLISSQMPTAVETSKLERLLGRFAKI